MAILAPNWYQAKPTSREAREMCALVALDAVTIESEPVALVLERLRATHQHGGAFLTAIRVGESNVFDWYASRNRLLEEDILPMLLQRSEIRAALPELLIPAEILSQASSEACTFASSSGFKFDNPFLLDGQLAQALFAGGAYSAETKIDARTAKRLALEFCEDVFGQRYEEVSLFTSYEPWTPWFFSIAWDWTAVLFDRRNRMLWILAVTDTD